jgi:hypothetical protein
MEFDFKIDQSFVSTWHPKYDEIETDEIEYKALLVLTDLEIREQKTLNEQTFRRIIDWKSPRLKGIFRISEFHVYAEGIRAAYLAEEDEKIGILLNLYGIGAPVASTILHCIYPNSLPIIDVRTVQTLYSAGRIKTSSIDASCYASFRTEMLSILSEISPITLRELDRALFAHHKIYLSQNQRYKNNKTLPDAPEAPRARSKMTVRDKVLRVFQNREGQTFAREKIIDLVFGAYPGMPRGSVIPSDYCYNLINKDSASFKLHLFESIGNGIYKCLGLNAAYSGPVNWKTELVGQWEKGKVRLWKDPRK